MSKRVLAVEDQEDNMQILRDAIVNAGYEIIEAENGEQALALAAKHRLDDGERKARAAGCDDFVAKPYSPRQLLAKIRQVLGEA